MNTESEMQSGAASASSAGLGSSPIEELERIGDLYSEYGFAAEAFLRRRGWKGTCKTPGCVWMWEKQMPDGRTLIVDRDMAMRFEEEM